jgi:hypothetical protein
VGDPAHQIETRWPDAAASLKEGLDVRFSVVELGCQLNFTGGAPRRPFPLEAN